MGISKEDLLELAEAMKDIDEYRLVAGTIIDKALECGPELQKVFEALTLGVADLRIGIIKHYEENGFTREEAILLTLDSWQSFLEHTKKGVKINQK